MNNAAIENIREVHGEAVSMLDNIKSVRGERYAQLVRALLLSSNIIEIHAMSMQLGDLPDHVRDVLGESMCKAVFGLMTSMASAAGFEGGELESATADASAMDESISSLLKGAVRSGLDGKGFGE